MARPRKLTGVNKKNFTKEEFETRKKEEEKLEQFEKIDASNIPGFLDIVAEKEWIRIIPLMELLPISELDRNMLAMYCSYQSVYIEAVKDVQINGITIEEERGDNIIKKQNPSMQTMLQASKEIKSIASTMGLTLDSRLRILNPKSNDEPKDPFADFFKDKEAD